MLIQSLFVGLCLSITLWYIGTPYIVKPSDKVIKDLLDSKIVSEPKSLSGTDNTIIVENWTKWRLYFMNEHGKEEIVYKNSAKYISLKGDETKMHFEWRPHYNIVIHDSPPHPQRWAEVESSWLDKYGIYDHLILEVIDNNRLRILPKFMFGIDEEILDKLYGGPEKMPIIGYLGPTPFTDRIVILSYLFSVLFVIFILLSFADNPNKMKKDHRD